MAALWVRRVVVTVVLIVLSATLLATVPGQQCIRWNSYLGSMLLASASEQQAFALQGEGGLTVAPERITREARYFAGQDSPEPEALVVDDQGNNYRLVSSDVPIPDADYRSPSNFYSRHITRDIPPDGIDNLGDYFPRQVYVADGQFAGNISLAQDPYDRSEVLESFTGQVDCSYSLENLPDNDVARLPREMDFEVRSDAGQGATEIKTLTLLDVRYEQTGTNTLGLPTSYSAHMTFRGSESWLQLHHYIVTAYYAGYIQSSVGQYVVVSHYELEKVPQSPTALPAEPVPAVPATTEPSVQPQSQLPNLVLAWAVAAVVVILAVAWLLVWLLFWRKNAALVQYTDGKSKTLLRRQLSVTAGETAFKIPSGIELYGSSKYSIELKPRLANQQGMLVVMWRDSIITRTELGASIEVTLASADSPEMLAVVAERLLGL